MAFTNVDTLRDDLAFLLVGLNLSRASSCWTSRLKRVATSLTQRILLRQVCHIFSLMFICMTRSGELNLTHACHEATLILMYQVSKLVIQIGKSLLILVCLRFDVLIHKRWKVLPSTSKTMSVLIQSLLEGILMPLHLQKMRLLESNKAISILFSSLKVYSIH